MSARDYSLEVSTRHQVFVDRYAGHTVKENLGIILQMNRDLQRIINTGGDLASAQVLTAKLREMENLIEETIDNLYEGVDDEMRRFARQESEFYQELLQTTATTTAATRIALPSEEILDRVVTRPMDLLQGKNKRQVTMATAYKEFGGKKSKEISRLVADGVVNGVERSTIASNVSRLVRKRTVRQAEALVRTTVHHVAGEARAATYQANADLIDYELWDSVLDGATTLTCAGLDGKKFKVGEGPQTPLHWNCRSARVAVLKREFQVLGLDGKRPARGPEGGTQVSGKKTYGGWLKDQPASFQDATLGPERGKLFRNGGLSINEFTTESGQVLTLSELRQSNPIAFERAGL